MGLCIVDMDRMLQGRGNDGHWVPDGSHPSDAVLYEYTNVLLNILQQHKDDAAHVARHRDVMRRFDNTMPTSFVSHFNLRDVTSQS